MSEQKICPTCGTEYPLSERFCPRDGTALRSANAQADLLGSIVADRYHILKKLGEGGMGTVYLAEHVKMGRKSALKVMNPGMNTDPDAIARFNREAANASRLSHPNICGIYDFGETPEGMIYLAMEFVEGSSLTALIEKAGALPAPRCGSIIHQTADALQVAHDAGIVHRDLKPDNIMVAKSRDGSDLVKVVDFGIAKASSSDAQKVTRTGLVVGTPEYMSPEQLAGDKLDGRSDIYSLGLVAFNCLTGKLPFPAETAQEAMIMRLTDRPQTLAQSRPEIAWTEELQRTLDKALERDAAERYQSAAQFGREFAAAISAMPVTQAAEAGTLVIAAAGSAPPGQVPPTRVRPSRDRTEQMEAPAGAPAKRAGAPAAAPAAARKSSMVPILGGMGGVAVVVAALWFTVLKPKGTADGTEGAGATDPAAAVTDSSKIAGGAPAGGDTSATSGSTQSSPVTPLSNPTTSAPNLPTGGTTGGSSTSNPPPKPSTATPPAATPNVSQLLASWRTRLENSDSATQVRVGADALREIEPLLDRLRGAELDQARFVALLAYGAVNDIPRTCRFARLVAESRLGTNEKSIATAFSQETECPAP